MKKRQFLAPLAVSIAALLGGAPLPAEAAVSTGVVTTAKPAEATAMPADQLVLTRSGGSQVQLADHESHASHESHSSHSSHSSHVSGS